MVTPPPFENTISLIESTEHVDDRQVTMSNKLARAAHSLGLAEKRLVALGLAATDSISMEELESAKKSGWKMRVKGYDYAEMFGISENTAYEQIKQGADHLWERYVRFEEPGKKGKQDTLKVRWVSAALHSPGQGYVELHFTAEIAPHLLGLREHFTSYKLRSAAVFDTVYAWRLFEVLKSWQNVGVYTVDIEDFWAAMDAPPSCRKDFKSLRVRVIEPAVAAIQARANMIVTWTPIRKGSRRVTSLRFEFGPNPQKSLIEPEIKAD